MVSRRDQEAANTPGEEKLLKLPSSEATSIPSEAVRHIIEWQNHTDFPETYKNTAAFRHKVTRLRTLHRQEPDKSHIKPVRLSTCIHRPIQVNKVILHLYASPLTFQHTPQVAVSLLRSF